MNLHISGLIEQFGNDAEEMFNRIKQGKKYLTHEKVIHAMEKQNNILCLDDDQDTTWIFDITKYQNNNLHLTYNGTAK